MSSTIPEPSAPLSQLTYLPRVGTYDHRAIEEALAGPTMFDRGVVLEGAIVEASYAAAEPAPPLLTRLRQEGIPFFVDLQTLRFASPAYLELEHLRTLSYAPQTPIEPDSFSRSNARWLSRAALDFQQRIGAGSSVVPALPVFDSDLAGWIRLNRELVEVTCEANGVHVDRRPLIAQVAPGPKALADPDLFLGWLPDMAIAGVYVQPLRLNPVRDSLEKLVRYVRFVRALKGVGLTVLVGRVGAFGLLLGALGADGFDSRLGDAEGFELSRLNRPPRRDRHQSGRRSGGGDGRIYFEALKTTLPGRYARELLGMLGLRTRFTCTLGCCQLRGFDDLPARRRTHYLWVRHHEVDDLRQRPTSNMRVQAVHEELITAREHAAVVRRAFESRGLTPPRFDHLDRWIGVLARESGVAAAA